MISIFHFILNEPADYFVETESLLKTQQDLVSIPWSKQITQQILSIETCNFFFLFFDHCNFHRVYCIISVVLSLCFKDT